MALALLGAGSVSTLQYALDDGRRFLERSVRSWRDLGDQARLAESLCWLAISRMQLGQAEDACAIFQDNESIIRQYADPWTLGLALGYWGRALAYGRADYAVGKLLLDESLSMGRRFKDPGVLQVACANFGHWALRQGDFEAATRYFLEELKWRRQVGTRFGIAVALLHVGDATRLQADYPEAQTFYSEALAAYQAVGDKLVAAYVLNGFGYLALHLGEPEQGAALFAESLEVHRERADQYGIAIGLAGYAELLRMRGRVEPAVKLLAQAAMIPELQGGFTLAGRIEHERSVSAARAQLGDDGFNAAWEAGRKLTLEQAIALALHDDL